MDFQSILVLHAGAIGDFLLALPAMVALHRRFPDATFTLAANSRLTPVVENLLRFRSIEVDGAKLTGLFAPQGDLGRAAEAIGAVELAVLWVEDSDETIRDNLVRLGARKVVGGKGKPPAGSGVHAADFFLSTLKGLGCRKPLVGPYLVVPAPLREAADDFFLSHGIHVRKNRPVAVHPGSGSRAKNWPVDRFARLIEALRVESNVPVLLLKAYADAEVFAKLSAHVKLENYTVMENEPLDHIAGAIRECRLYIGNDSGISHLAGAIGKRSLIIFGPTDHRVWSPPNPNTTALAGEQPGEFPSLETVLKAAKKELE